MFEQLHALSVDPILGLVAAYSADVNPHKVDLGAGVYKDESGHTPIMAAVVKAQALWAEQEGTKVYAPPAGFAGFNEGMMNLLLGKDHPALRDGRVVSVQTPGGCGALRIAAGMLSRCHENSRDNITVWVSTPTWANHIPLLGSAGLTLREYPYYDYNKHGIDFDGMMATLAHISAGDVVLLHGCCHNPSGADLTQEQWRTLANLVVEKGATPFIDVAYQGLGDGLDEDAYGLRYLAEHCPEVVVASSCSKNFGLYRERVGAAMVIANTPAIAEVCRGQLLNVAREIYSMPPSHGAAIVDLILHDDVWTKQWQDELKVVRERIAGLRESFVSSLTAAGTGDRFNYIQNEKGMFSFLGITPEQVGRLKENSIYMVGSSRINIAGLNSNNMDYVVESLLKVI
ncbi:MAG: aspartate aminotransferase [Cellvibrionaceae bacterium]|jgi:aspartate aminotransferase